MPDDIYQPESLGMEPKAMPQPLFVSNKLAGAADSSVIGVDSGKIVNTDGIPKGKPKVRQSAKGWPTVQYQSAWNPPSIDSIPMEHEGVSVGATFTRPKDQLLFKMLKGMSDSRINLLKQADSPASEAELAKAWESLNMPSKKKP